MAKDETKVTAEVVEREHLNEVRSGLQATYLFGVLVGSFLLMVALIALLGATAG